MTNGPGRPQIRDYEALVATHKKSGLSLNAFAKREGIPSSTLARWKKRLDREEVLRPGKPQPLLPVRLSNPLPVRLDSEPTAEFEVRLRCGHEVRLSRGFDVSSLRALVDVLEERSSCSR